MQRLILSGLLSLLLLLHSGCSVIFSDLPEPADTMQRIQSFPADPWPVGGEISIHWDKHLIPFIEAEKDQDLAFALGMVHAHLRLGQMELMRLLTAGRLSEIAGPVTADIDHSLRILNYGKAVPEIWKTMPSETKIWVTEFVRGINYYRSVMKERPHEYDLFDLKEEEWTPEDVLRIGRFAGTDVTWMFLAQQLKLSRTEAGQAVRDRILKNGVSAYFPVKPVDSETALYNLLLSYSRSGSNSWAVAPSRTKENAAIMANDPHLGVGLPSTWIIAAVKSETWNAAGFMVPSLPFFAIGRNPDIAWGGTNMRAASSDLYDITDWKDASLKERSEKIRIRWYPDRNVTIRESAAGPVISDSPVFSDLTERELALRWTGHEVSDELTAFLKAGRAKNFTSFRDAFRGYSVSGQNMLYADKEGNIGMVLAVRIPFRKNMPDNGFVLNPEDPGHQWKEFRNAADLPSVYNPPEGFIASANNRPYSEKTRKEKGLPVISWAFSAEDRIRRLRSLLGGSGRLDINKIKEIQRDVYSESAVRLRDFLLNRSGNFCSRKMKAAVVKPCSILSAWDGRYNQESEGALVFQVILKNIIADYYTERYGEESLSFYYNSEMTADFLYEDLQSESQEKIRDLLYRALLEASEKHEEFGNWGSMHRHSASYTIGSAPLIGSRYRISEIPAEGSSTTVYKSAHQITDEKHVTRYGSNSRHISVMNDPDENYFLLLGGQDGRYRSSNAADQLELWQEGEYVKVPLSPDQFRKKSVYTHNIKKQ